MILTGLDRLLAKAELLAGKRYGLLAHAASVSSQLEPAHLALSRSHAGAPTRLLGPEHGFYGIEQDMVASADGQDPWTGVPIVSLYGTSPESLRPTAEVFAGLDVLVIDVQDVGARYYTYAASAVWSAEVALAAGCEVWVLDRPNPLGGLTVEGNLPQAGYQSFVGAFQLPIRHGLTLGELTLLEAQRRQWPDGLRVWRMEGWERRMSWLDTGRPWIAPSPNVPSPATTLVYPGVCLVEATELSEGRGTTRPFQLVGAPYLDPVPLAEKLAGCNLPGVVFLPTYFRPQFHKHSGECCGGVEIVVTEPDAFRSYRTGIELLFAARSIAPESFRWRQQPYEFVVERPAIDLLTGSDHCRQALERGQMPDEWIATWRADEETFRRQRQSVLLYPEAGQESA